MTQLFINADSNLNWKGRFKALFTGKLSIRTKVTVNKDEVRILQSTTEVHVGERPSIYAPGTEKAGVVSSEVKGPYIADNRK